MLHAKDLGRNGQFIEEVVGYICPLIFLPLSASVIPIFPVRCITDSSPYRATIPFWSRFLTVISSIKDIF